MATLRTPESRFVSLPDYPFAANYCELEPSGLRMHYVDEGPRDANPVLMLHGEPTWGYLYRNFIPRMSKVGRVVVPDHMGFGKSEPTRCEEQVEHSCNTRAAELAAGRVRQRQCVWRRFCLMGEPGRAPRGWRR